jgi:sugar lactone lactonase YvrE
MARPSTPGCTGRGGVRLDGKGNLFIADWDNYRIRKVVLSTGVVTTVAGNGIGKYSGDGGPATQAGVDMGDLAVDRDGNLYIADFGNDRIRKVTAANGTIATVAGTVAFGFSGDNGPALLAKLSGPTGVSVDPQGVLYFADTFNLRVRKVDQSTGIISTVAGNGNFANTGDETLAASAAGLLISISTAVEANGDLLILTLTELRRVTMADGKIHQVAGSTTTRGNSGDGGPASAALFGDPQYVTIAQNGGILVADNGNFKVRRIRANSIETVAGRNPVALDIPATSVFLNAPAGVVADGQGGFWISDSGNHALEIVSSAGIITNSGILPYFYCVINYTRRRQHKGQHGSRCTRNRAIWIRSVAIEWGLWRWARTLRPPRPEVGRYWGGA